MSTLKPGTFDARWTAKVRPDPSGCWIWEGFCTPDGYGKYSRGPEKWAAHRYAVSLREPLIPGNHVMHLCDVRNCVNPDHLRQGTPAENTADMMAKGRKASPRYGPQPHTRLMTPSQVRDAHDAWHSGTSTRALAERYGVSMKSIRRAVHVYYNQ